MTHCDSSVLNFITRWVQLQQEHQVSDSLSGCFKLLQSISSLLDNEFDDNVRGVTRWDVSTVNLYVSS